MTVRIAGVCGSLQARSANRELLEIAARSAPEGVTIVTFEGLRGLPPFDPDLEEAEPHPAVQAWRRALAASDGVLIACPEYGFSLPGTLKNAIDWVIGSGELERKVVAITAAVPHADRGRRGLRALRDTLNAVSARIVGGEPIARGPTFESEVAALLHALVQEIERAVEAT